MLKNLNISTRLFLLVGIVALSIIYRGYNGWSNTELATQSLQQVFKTSIDSLSHLYTISHLYNDNIANSLQRMRDRNLSWPEALQNIMEAKNKISKNWEEYLKSGLTPEQRNLAEQIQNFIDRANASLDKFQDIVKRQDQTLLTQYAVQEILPLRDSINSALTKLIQLHVQESKQFYKDAIEQFSFLKRFIVITSIVGVIICVFFCFIILGITKPLKFAVDTVNKLAVGNNDIEINIKSNDEISQLLKAMQNMIDSTNSMTAVLSALAEGDLTVDVAPRSKKDTLGYALKHLIEKKRKTVAQLQEKMNILKDSTHNIVASVIQVSTGTSETATAVAETTSTAEELKQTARLSDEKASNVHEHAEETLKIVKKSENSLISTIEDMDLIQQKMTLISACILKLSEHSAAIGEIIDTVNDMAEQSNLLAVNAAIEAAKVGEQGKGFGVVAKEIRVLAEQSKAATHQIRAILRDVQNAANDAVMATEAGFKAVKKGVNQSQQTNDAMHALSLSISQVALAANQISISSHQQLIGIEQVTIAIGQVNEASDQNVKNMKQIEEAVLNLNDIGGTLKNLTDQYLLPEKSAAKTSKDNFRKIKKIRLASLQRMTQSNSLSRVEK